MPYSTSYNVCVRAVNKNEGHCAYIKTDTPPEIPKFSRDPQSFKITYSEISITIPPISYTETSKNRSVTNCSKLFNYHL